MVGSDDVVGAGGLDMNEVLSPITLPCGRTLANRLVKAAMYEHLAPLLGGPPTAAHHALYAVWARGGWGMIVTGNVQVSRRHLTLGADMIVPEKLTYEDEEKFRKLACAMKGKQAGGGDVGNADDTRGSKLPLAIMQLNHSGRQSPNIIGGRWPYFQPPLSASATRVGASATRKENLLSRVAYALLFQTARAMSVEDIADVVGGFVRGARLALASGFDGIQIHAAHGCAHLLYLIAQFISRRTNLRTDAYSAPVALLREIVYAVRAAVPRIFVVGIKLNAADYVSGGLREEDGRAHLAEIAGWEWEGAGVDFIEVSGGDYESPEFMQDSSPRQAFFESFARVAMDAVRRPAASPRQPSGQSHTKAPPLIMLTGGLRTRAQFALVLKSKHADLLGLARLATLQPDLPNFLLEHQLVSGIGVAERQPPKGCSVQDVSWEWERQPTPEPRSPSWWPRIVGAGIGMAWYVVAIRRLAQGSASPYSNNWVFVVLEMYFGSILDGSGKTILIMCSLVAVSLFCIIA
ncbi:FMN-linked oxidoreductase [Phellopilus nigrolimitatus]|nr:FMN-linked oxidoreductase [Phellopilus nigrolimitatus]